MHHERYCPTDLNKSHGGEIGMAPGCVVEGHKEITGRGTAAISPLMKRRIPTGEIILHRSTYPQAAHKPPQRATQTKRDMRGCSYLHRSPSPFRPVPRPSSRPLPIVSACAATSARQLHQLLVPTPLPASIPATAPTSYMTI